LQVCTTTKHPLHLTPTLWIDATGIWFAHDGPKPGIMSVLSSDVHSALTQLLQGLQSPDNTVRTQAETNLNNEWVNTRPDVLLLGLVEQLGGSNDEGVSLSCEEDHPLSATRFYTLQDY
jgi:hypothetical protein